jgi:mRNA-degrading endonuclease RelE of RelBE toxin-antitoxin system
VAHGFFRVRITHESKEMLRRVGKKYGQKSYGILRDLIRDLECEPQQKGQPLHGQLRGLYSLHYSRFRVLYKVERSQAIVLVVGAGYHQSDSRSDIYRVIERLVESGHIELHPPQDD